MTTEKTKSEIREELVAVSDDQNLERGTWLKEGEWVSIFTVDPIVYGQIERITPTHYFLKNSSWIADTGRQHSYVVDPTTAREVEFVGEEAIERPVTRIIRHPHQDKCKKLETK